MSDRVPKLKAPFPAFGGKSKVASLVWERLGDVDNYVEPFCNSAAVLLARPHDGRIETVNDWDCYVANFWRATAHDPEAVAFHADNPVNEADLHARHRWLVLSDYAQLFRHLMRTDPTFYDVRVAGWWVWGANCWIGSGWCSDRAVNDDGTMWQQRPAGHDHSEVMNAWLNPNARPQLADAFSRGRGVNGNDRAETCSERLAWLSDWMVDLRNRLRTVRVICGDWLRTCESHSTTTRLGLTGVFLDAPYRTHLADGKSNRSRELYASDRDSDVNALVDRVIAYCLERGSDQQMRIVACCYEGEGYEVLSDHGWTVEEWKASGGYGNQSGKVNDNAARERIWFSPACVKAADEHPLFAGMET